jgi:hypothetical protein
MIKALMITSMLVMAAAYSSAWSDTAGGRHIVCLDQRRISMMMAEVCDGPEDVSDDMNKDHYSWPGGRGKGSTSYDDAVSWIRRNCNYRFVLTPSPTVHTRISSLYPQEDKVSYP